jgi:biopolymer transport protein ExbD
MNELDALDFGPKKARVEIIPLIDVIFFLLATFVLFTLSLEKIRVIETTLPAGDGRPREDHTTAFIQAAGDGTYHWKVGRQRCARGDHRGRDRGSRLAHYRTTSVAVPRVMVRSDRHATMRTAVIALDEVRRAGIRQVAVETMVSAPGS